MIRGIKNLPLHDKEEFFSDSRNSAAAEAYLRRALEALFDRGRHIIAKGSRSPQTEYKEIARELFNRQVLSR